MLVMIPLSSLALVLVSSIAYSPIISTRPTGSHIHTKGFGIAITAIYALLDAAILSMALQRMWQLKMAKKLKALVSFVFLLGILYANHYPLCAS